MYENTIFMIKGTDRYVLKLAEYTNGILTSCGFYNKDELKEIHNELVPVEFSVEAAAELPVSWPELDFCGVTLLDIDFVNNQFITDKGVTDKVCLYMFS